MSAQADPPVQKETEETGGDSQPDVTISSHNSMGNLDPALGQTGKGSQQLGDHDPALGQTGKGSRRYKSLIPSYKDVHRFADLRSTCHRSDQQLIVREACSSLRDSEAAS